MFGVQAQPPEEMLGLLDIEPYEAEEIGRLARELLRKANKDGLSKLTVDEYVELRLISSYFRN